MRLVFIITATIMNLICIASYASDKVVGDLSNNKISINANFQGSDILIFGTIKSNQAKASSHSDIIIEVIGPKFPIILRKKSRVFGIWVNRDNTIIKDVPTFYSITTSENLDKIISRDVQYKKRIGFKNLLDTKEDVSISDHLEAIVRIKKATNSYVSMEGKLGLLDNTLFSTKILLPTSLVEGNYNTRIHLVQSGQIIDTTESIITVKKAGLGRWLYKLANDNAFIYGILSIILALFSGWIASEIFRLVRR